MARFSGFDEVLSALYVDFDNIYTRFLEQDAEAARSFGLTPYRWVRWLENHSLRILYGDGVRRRIIKRMCYLNPQRYQEFRNPFIRSAFQVVDCPPLTSRGKTSTDIHLVMDCMDDLSHSTHFDEFIILSGDADFTPLLIRLQEHARRTLLLSVGYSSPAYTAAASWRIREDWFIQQALKDERPDYREERAEVDEVRQGSTLQGSALDASPTPVAERMDTARIISLGQRPGSEHAGEDASPDYATAGEDESAGPGNC